jgi:hypothetical protein
MPFSIFASMLMIELSVSAIVPAARRGLQKPNGAMAQKNLSAGRFFRSIYSLAILKSFCRSSPR